MAAEPEFVVVAVNKTGVLSVSEQWLGRGFAVLAETPAACDRDSLAQLQKIAAQGKRLVTAEQYRFFPENAARLNLLKSGIIGEPSFLYLSLAHEYHAASLMRAFLQVPAEMPYSIHAYSSAYPTVETMTRYERIADGRMKKAVRTAAVICFADGRTCLYDFDSEQYRSLIRSSHYKLQGTRGELYDDTCVWLDETSEPRLSRLAVHSHRIHTGDTNPNLSEYETVDRITFANRLLYECDPDFADLARDETAIAHMLADMSAYAKGKGVPPYSLTESIADARMAILLRESAESGKEAVYQICTEQQETI